MTPRILNAAGISPTVLGSPLPTRLPYGGRYRVTTSAAVAAGQLAEFAEAVPSIDPTATPTGAGLLTFHGCRDRALGCVPVTVVFGWADTRLDPPLSARGTMVSGSTHPLQNPSKGPLNGGAAGRFPPSKGDFRSDQ